MIQIGSQPPSAIFADGSLRKPDEEIGGLGEPESLLDSSPPEDASEGIVFVSPPPLPFPRVFPGL